MGTDRLVCHRPCFVGTSQRQNRHVTRLMLNAKPQRPVMTFDDTPGFVTDRALDVPQLEVVEAAG